MLELMVISGIPNQYDPVAEADALRVLELLLCLNAISSYDLLEKEEEVFSQAQRNGRRTGCL
tara:strand:- start:220 stop:405 length:186 start_codon:yes stop_codon:yes gene_type:complete